jgi:hypothetical protein
VREWVAFEHGGYPRQVAETWWRRRGQLPIPSTVDEALRRTPEIRPVTHLKIEHEHGKFPKILAYRFGEAPVVADANHAPREGRVPVAVPQDPGGDP